MPLGKFEHRFAMLSLAFAGVQNVFLSRLEQFREGPSFTIDTLCHLKKAVDGKRQWFFAIGKDALAEIHTWKQYQSIPDIACLVVFNRTLETIPSTEELVRRVFPKYGFSSDSRQFFEKNTEKIRLIDMPAIDISSSQIKQAIANNESWQLLVPKAVSAYIVAHQLYK
jgi:nicotinate-nucleotide adenylyltransferase